jgi:hypothetical protein
MNRAAAAIEGPPPENSLNGFTRQWLPLKSVRDQSIPRNRCLGLAVPKLELSPFRSNPPLHRRANARTGSTGAGAGSFSLRPALTSLDAANGRVVPLGVATVNFIVEAKDPGDGATILVACLTRGEALAAVANCVREGQAIIRVTDRKGTLVALGLPD